MTCGQSHFLPLPAVGDESQTSRLADEVALSIHLGQLRPGSPLREVELADNHGVSRTIVRAALQKLEAQGLAEIVLNKGARVRAVCAEAAADMIDLHADLMALGARHAAKRARPADLSRMRDYLDMMDHVAEDKGSAEEFQHLRIGFTRSLYEAAGDVLAERLRSAAPVVPHHERAMDDVRSVRSQVEAAKLAREVLRAVEGRDAEGAAKAAERLVRRHGESSGVTPPTPPARRGARRAA